MCTDICSAAPALDEHGLRLPLPLPAHIDLQSDTFLEEVNRSAQATALVVEGGFTELPDAGGRADLEAAGADVTDGSDPAGPYGGRGTTKTVP